MGTWERIARKLGVSIFWALSILGASTLRPATGSAATLSEAACHAATFARAAVQNASSLDSLEWAPFGRGETGWRVYAPVVQQAVQSDCPPASEGFAAALARFQAGRGLTADGRLTPETFQAIRDSAQAARPFVARLARGVCPDPADVIAAFRPEDALGERPVWADPGAMAAWRRLIQAARAEVAEIAADPELLRPFSGYRSPSLDRARCLADGNCDGVARATCSAHRTGMALDLYVGHAPGFSADSTASESRLHMSGTPAYRWLVDNAARFGFVNYLFEPWHWEWTGAAARP